MPFKAVSLGQNRNTQTHSHSHFTKFFTFVEWEIDISRSINGYEATYNRGYEGLWPRDYMGRQLAACGYLAICRRFSITIHPGRFLNAFLGARLKFTYNDIWKECCQTWLPTSPPAPSPPLLPGEFFPQLVLGPPNNRLTEVMSFVVFSVSGKYTVYGRPTGATWTSSRPEGWSKLILLLCITQGYSKRNVTGF